MFAADDIGLIRDQLIKIKKATYFDRPLLEHTESLIKLCDFLSKYSINIDDRILMESRRILFSEQMFLSGTIASEVPYEVVYSLRLALTEWGHKNDLITTALLADQNFYFLPSKGIWRFVEAAVPQFAPPQEKFRLIQVAFPRLYRTKPLFAIPLYHELGHFIDITHRISELLLMSLTKVSSPAPMILLNHLREHFADLFAASYCGKLSTGLLPLIAGYQSASHSHPSTIERIALVDAYLGGRQNQLIDQFQSILKQLNLPSLYIRHTEPDVRPYFDNMRPVKLRSQEDVHGLYLSATAYMNERKQNPSGSWMDQSPDEVVRIINDLVEKSIRTFEIESRWHSEDP